MHHSSPLLDAALRYADLGYPVFPCVPGGKVPLTEHGFKDATTDATQIEVWWAQQPSANIGMPTEGLIVVDIDGHDNSWPGDTDRAYDLSRCPVSRTPRGGSHHLFRQPLGKSWGNTASKLAPHVDTRGNGGYIVVPPSVVGGRPYQWAETMELDDRPDRLPEPPAWVIVQLEGRGNLVASKGAGAVQTLEDGNPIPKGQRHQTLVRLGGIMRNVGMDEREICAALLEVNQKRCQPPRTSAQVQKIAHDMMAYAPDQIQVAIVENHFGQDAATARRSGTLRQVESPGPIPEELLRVPGFVSEVMDYSLATAHYPNVAMAFAGALALQAVLAGRKVRDSAKNRTNLYLLALAFSASGKDRPRKVNIEIMNAIGLTGQLGNRFSSGEGLEDALYLEPCMLFQTDEIDGMLQSISKSKEARYESIMSTLLMMYSSADSIFAMRRKAGDESARTINQPCLCLLGTAIPNHYYEALSDRMLTNGFFARMIVIECGMRPASQEPEVIDIPARILETAKDWAERPYSPSGNLGFQHPTPAVVPQSAKARGLITEMRLAADEEYRRAEVMKDAVGTTVWGRVGENVRKLALVYAISENSENPEIGESGVRWASAFVMHQARLMLFQASGHVAESQFHAQCLRCLDFLRQADGQELIHSALLRKMKMDAKSFASLIATLEQSGELVVRTLAHDGSGRSGKAYAVSDYPENSFFHPPQIA